MHLICSQQFCKTVKTGNPQQPSLVQWQNCIHSNLKHTSNRVMDTMLGEHSQTGLLRQWDYCREREHSVALT